MNTNNYMYIPTIILHKVHINCGRSNGKITVRHRGGGIKYLYTNIDFKYKNYDSSLALILKFYLDYNRTSIVSLILILNGKLKGYKKLLLSTNGLSIGNIISLTNNFPIQLGSIKFIRYITIGLYIHSIETIPNTKSILVRSLGTKAKVIYHTNKYTCIKLPSNKFKLINNKCRAIIGQNSLIYYRKITKAGHRKLQNRRPTVCGISMNPIDHPHGGGCGHSSIGLKSSKTPWGKYHYGVKTSKFKKLNKFIVL